MFSSKYFSSKFYRRFLRSVRATDNNQAVNANETFTDYKNNNKTIENEMPDYRHEYIKVENDDEINHQSMLINEERPLPQDNSFACVSISDFELNTLNATTTSFFSPSTNSLPNDDVQQITTEPIVPQPIGSILVRAYSQQERNKSAYPQ